MAAIDYVYRYSHPSSLDTSEAGSGLRLAAELNEHPDTRYFAGDLLNPVITARSLRTVSDLVGTRFYIPPSMLARILREADPVATISRDRIRFEGFSACCSTYIRHDMSDASFAAEHVSPGTTNVDFGAEMRAALAEVRTGSSLQMRVDKEAVELQEGEKSVIERKVPLPTRWIRGFAEVQAHLRDMSLAMTLTRVQAQRFLRSLPRAQADHEQWAIPSPQGARLSVRPSGKGVMIKGTQRLRLFEKLAADANSLEIWFNEQQGSSAWVLDYGDQRLMLVLNSEPWRGFSGDGQLLSDLGSPDDATVAAVKAQLKWQGIIDLDQVSRLTGYDEAGVQRALGFLAAHGVLGFDLPSGSYFHRVLPFDLSLIEKLNPRLKSADALYKAGAVKLSRSEDGHAAEIESDGIVHRVTYGSSGSTCTCPWYAKHLGTRGPCKHVLATEMALNESA
ncbi:MAG: SWIM zinc finger family protein [Pseudomonadota bacterium]